MRRPLVPVRSRRPSVIISGCTEPPVPLEPNGRVLRRNGGREKAVNAEHETERHCERTHRKSAAS